MKSVGPVVVTAVRFQTVRLHAAAGSVVGGGLRQRRGGARADLSRAVGQDGSRTASTLRGGVGRKREGREGGERATRVSQNRPPMQLPQPHSGTQPPTHLVEGRRKLHLEVGVCGPALVSGTGKGSERAVKTQGKAVKGSDRQ